MKRVDLMAGDSPDKIIEEQAAQGNTLAQVCDLLEGSFLVFREPSDATVQEPAATSLEDRIAAVEKQVAELKKTTDDVSASVKVLEDAGKVVDL